MLGKPKTGNFGLEHYGRGWEKREVLKATERKF